MKKILKLTLIAVLLAATVLTFGVFAEDEGRDITVNLDGSEIVFDVEPMLIEGRTMVPVRAIFEALGAVVTWDGETSTATGVKDDVTVKITIDEKQLYRNGETVELDVSAKLINWRTLVPLRAISQCFDVLVEWDDATSTVTLSSRKKAELTKEEFVAGNGYAVKGKDGTELTADEKAVTVATVEDGVQVSHGGYYNDGKNWGGVALNEKHLVNGLSATIRFDRVPEVVAGHDCWISIDFLAKPQLFQVGDIPGNPGFVNLIRFSNNKWEIYNGYEKWANAMNIESETSMFAVKTGDVITVSAKREGDYYTFTYTNGENTVSWTYENADFTNCFEDGLAHLVVAASCNGSEKDAFMYTITEVSYYK